MNKFSNIFKKCDIEIVYLRNNNVTNHYEAQKMQTKGERKMWNLQQIQCKNDYK